MNANHLSAMRLLTADEQAELTTLRRDLNSLTKRPDTMTPEQWETEKDRLLRRTGEIIRTAEGRAMINRYAGGRDVDTSPTFAYIPPRKPGMGR